MCCGASPGGCAGRGGGPGGRPEGGLDRLTYLVTFGVAAALAAWLTPKLREAALRFGIVDAPDGALKTHREPVQE